MSQLSIYDYPAPVQDEAAALRRAFESLIQSTGRTPGKRDLRLIARPDKEGWSLSHLDRKLRAWLRAGCDDLALIDKRRFPQLWNVQTERGLPADFLIYAGSLMLGNQRASKPAYRDLIDQWKDWRRTGKKKFRIPGYDTPPPDGGKGRPEGWSYDNLMKCAQPPVEELAMARIGTVAAKPFLPWINGTREGVRWLEWVYFDDVWQDRNCCVAGSIEPVRILQLGALDYASGLYLKFGIRPDLTRTDGTRDRLKRRDFLWLVATLLMEYGYPADYVMHFVVERGTATLSQAEAQTLFDLSGGQIQVGYTSMEGQFVLAWEEAKCGNAQGKSPLESWHNLFHNELASLPGQTGKDRDHSPATLANSNREVAALNKAALLLTPDQRAKLKLPYPSLEEAHAQTLAKVDRINRRRDHNLESTGRVMLWRLKGSDMDWRPEGELLNLDPSVLANVDFLPVKESPFERAMQLSAQSRVNFVPPGALVRFYEDSHTPHKLKNVDARFKVGDKTFTFGPETPEEALPIGSEIILHYAPVDPQFAIVTHNGICVGIWKRRLVMRGDQKALTEEMGRKQRFLQHTISSVRGKRAEFLQAEQTRMDENLQVLAEAGLIEGTALRDLAAGRELINTPVAEGMATAIQKVRSREAANRAAANEESELAERAEAALAKRNAEFSTQTQTTQTHDDNDSF